MRMIGSEHAFARGNLLTNHTTSTCFSSQLVPLIGFGRYAASPHDDPNWQKAATPPPFTYWS